MNFRFHFQDYIQTVAEGIQTIDSGQLELFLKRILRVRERGRKIIFVGNGGSALNAAHFSMGISVVSKKWNKPFKSIVLSESASLMSSISNDYSFDEVYSRMLRICGDRGDLLVVLSSSGNSKNLVRCVLTAKELKIDTFGLVGRDGGQLKDLCDHSIHIPCEKGDAGFAEDAHMVIGHAITSYLEHVFEDEAGLRGPDLGL